MGRCHMGPWHTGKWHMGTLDKSVHPLDSNLGGTDRLPSSATHYSGPWNHAYDTTFATESKTQTFNPTAYLPTTGRAMSSLWL